jgi:hypothetical protein
MPQTHITTCLLCKPEKPATIKANEMPPFCPEDDPPQAVLTYLKALRQHIEKRHPEAFNYAVALGHTLTALVVIGHFATTDPEIQRSKDLTRAFLHKATRKNDVTERDLQIRWENLYGCTDEQETIAGLKDLRDWLLEEGEYAPQALEPEAVKA